MPAGRPTKYDPGYHPNKAYQLCLLGLTDEELAKIFDIAVSTLNLWKVDHSEFSESVKKGKDYADANVADRLYQRAMGYEHYDVDIRVVDHEIVQTPLIKHYPPDTTAGIFWLKNRQPKKWRDKQELGMTDKDGNDVKPVTVFQIPDNGRNGA